MKEEIVSLHQDYNCGSLVLKASVLPIGYVDPLDLMTFCLVNTFPICNTYISSSVPIFANLIKTL